MTSNAEHDDRSEIKPTEQIKCVVWDLDNTLWNGTLLEGDDLVLMPGVTNIIRELDNRGILQSIASKNDHATAWQKVADFGLDDYFLHPQIHWGEKTASIKMIAGRLRVPLNTFAFVDDQDLERDEVRYCFPEVIVVDSADMNTLLEMARLQPTVITNESRGRRQMYKADILREQSESSFVGTRAQFLETLGMHVTIRPASGGDLARAEELTVRTHQLNTTGRFYSCARLNELINRDDHLVLVADLTDRYGSSGTIGLALIERRPKTWTLNLLIMSCRVLTRGVGGIMITHILQLAKNAGANIRAEFAPTPTNRLMYMLYKFHGFCEVGGQDDFIVLAHDLKRIRPFPRHVTVRSQD
jgi:FkbH-like protein